MLETPKYLLNIIDDYLLNRHLDIGNKEVVDVTAGVPQGSILGPTLWNIVYNDVLRQRYPEGVNAVAFADDLALTVRANTEYELTHKVEIAISIVEEWMERKGLTLAEQKTEAVVLKGPRKKENLVFRVGATEIKTSKCAKYLGIILKENGVYTEHLKEAVRKAEERTTILSRLMPNVGGPDSCKRKMLHGVVKSVVLYGAQLWYPILDKITYKNMLARAERKSLLRLCSAYRTASTTALNVIAGEIPLHLLARERHRLHTRQEVNEQVKKEERNESMRKWQEEWERTEGVAQWTKRMIPNLQRWVECKHRSTDYYLTQALTGHGTFKTYLKRFGISDNDKCKYCGEVDTVQHTLFECHRWETERRDLNSKIEEIIGVDTFLDHMLSCKEKWRDIREFIKKVLQIKQQEE